MRKLLLAAAMIGMVGPAGADTGLAVNGSFLLDACEGDLGKWGEGACLFYIIGYGDGMEYGSMITLIELEGYPDYETTHRRHQQFMKICTPERVTNGQKEKIIVAYLRDHPERLHESAKFLIPAALEAAFPCPE